MKLHPPIKGYKNSSAPSGSVSQWFGENRELYFSRFKMEGHNGIDIVAPHGTPIYAVEGGIVAEVKDSPEGYGKHVRIISEGSGSIWTYGHNSKNYVKIGDEVKAGDHIADMGNTGFVVSSHNGGGFWRAFSNKWAGTHLHLDRRLVKISKKKKAGYWTYNKGIPYVSVINHDNGFFGCVDFKDMFGNEEKEFNGVKESVLRGALKSLAKRLGV